MAENGLQQVVKVKTWPWRTSPVMADGNVEMITSTDDCLPTTTDVAIWALMVQYVICIGQYRSVMQMQCIPMLSFPV